MTMSLLLVYFHTSWVLSWVHIIQYISGNCILRRGCCILSSAAILIPKICIITTYYYNILTNQNIPV